jgi:hypothetical protein
LEGFPDELKATFVAVLEVLRLDPKPPKRVAGIYWRELKAFGKLRDQGVPANIFKAFEVQSWRVFYFIHERRHLVRVEEIVPREPDPYEDEALAQRLRDSYRRTRKELR